MAVFPGALAFYPVTQVLSDVKIGTGPQNIYWVDKGGYSGEISAEMYPVGRGQIRFGGPFRTPASFKETNHETREKLEAALNAGLIPVLCVGETLKERKDGEAEKVVEIQLRALLDNLKWPAKRELIIAYEPVWAIGTGEACDPGEAEKSASFYLQSGFGIFKSGTGHALRRQCPAE